MELEFLTKIRLFLAYGMDLGIRYLKAFRGGMVPAVTAAAAVLLVLMVFLLSERAFREVTLWNIGWDGREYALGKLHIRRRRGVGSLVLPEEYVERCRTTAFRIRPGIFLKSAWYNEELVIQSAEKRIRLEFSGPMRFMI